MNQWTPNDWRTGAICYSLSVDTKAQGQGVVSLIADHNTPWFTQLNTTKYSGWGKGAIDSVRMAFAHV